VAAGGPRAAVSSHRPQFLRAERSETGPELGEGQRSGNLLDDGGLIASSHS
jgi:hypothetical protein